MQSCCTRKAISITQAVWVFVALIIHHATRMRHIVIFGLPRSTIFFHVSHKRNDFALKTFLNKKCVFRVSLQLSSEIFFILRRPARDMLENVCWYSGKVPFFRV